MSITYAQLDHLNLSRLNQAITAWKEVVRKVKEVDGSHDSRVQRPFDSAGWTTSGPIDTAGYAAKEVAKARREAGELQKQARTIETALTDARDKLRAQQKKLHDYVRGVTSNGKVRISDRGMVTFTESVADDARLQGQPGYGQAVAAEQQRIDEIASEIEQILRDAAEADDSAAAALGYEAGGDKQGGNGGADAAKKTDGWTAKGEADATGPDAGASATGVAYGKQGMLKAYADLGHATAKGSLSSGDVQLSGIGDAYAGARATASAGMTDSGISGDAEVSAGGRAMTEGRVEAGHAGAYLRASGFAGAEAKATAGVGQDGVKVGAKAFAGAKADVAAGVEAAGIGAGVTAEGWAGPGAEAEVKFGKEDDGKFHVGAKAGVSPIVGGAVGFEFTVDPEKVSDAAGDAADAVGDAAGAVGDAAGAVKDGVTSLF